jgi:hypothetical protein
MWGHATMALMTLKEIPKKVETALEKYGPFKKALPKANRCVCSCFLMVENLNLKPNFEFTQIFSI